MTTNPPPSTEQATATARPPRAKRPTSKKGGRGKTDTTKLKVSLIIGSVLATLVGGEMLARQDFFTEAAAEPVQTAPIVVQQTDGTEWVVSDAPIAQLVIPDPVTTSQSSG